MPSLRIIGTDNLARETVADDHVIWFPERERKKAQEFCDWLNSFMCTDNEGTYYKIVDNTYRLSRGMADLV